MRKLLLLFGNELGFLLSLLAHVLGDLLFLLLLFDLALLADEDGVPVGLADLLVDLLLLLALALNKLKRTSFCLSSSFCSSFIFCTIIWPSLSCSSRFFNLSI